MKVLDDLLMRLEKSSVWKQYSHVRSGVGAGRVFIVPSSWHGYTLLWSRWF